MYSIGSIKSILESLIGNKLLYSGNCPVGIFFPVTCHFFQLCWLIMTTFCIPTLFSIGCPGESCLRDSEKGKFWTRDPLFSEKNAK